MRSPWFYDHKDVHLLGLGSHMVFAEPAITGIAADLHINPSINVRSVALKFIEHACQQFAGNHLFG
jgi:hypothetical protein